MQDFTFSNPPEEERMEGHNEKTSYSYSDNYEDNFCSKEEVIKVGSVLIPLFFGIVIVLSLIGNVLVLVVLALYENLKSLTNVFILNLAVSDLLFTAGLPFWALYYVWGWTLEEPACKAISFIFYTGFYSSVVFLMLMTVQRYMAVVYPLSDWEKRQGLALIPILGWLVSIAVALPAPIYSIVESDPADSSHWYCELSSRNMVFVVTYIQNSFFVCSFVIMGFCYVRILQTINKTRTNKRHRTIRLIFCIVVIFVIDWAPYNLVTFLHTLTYHRIPFFTKCEVTDHLNYATYVTKLLAFSHCCLNPVFYVFVGVKFRNYLKEILQKIFHRPVNTVPSQTRTANPQSLGTLY